MLPGSLVSMPPLLHFVASWASAICGLHVSEVSVAAGRLGASVITVDIDEHPELAREYGVPNVPSVAVEGFPSSLVVGARSADALVEILRSLA